MKTIGIVTIDDYTNYGNRLQNYALTKLFEQEGFSVINGIRVNTKQDFVMHSKSVIKRLGKMLMPYSILKKSLSFKEKAYTGLMEQKYVKFLDFNNSYTKVLPPIVAINHMGAMRKLEKYQIDFFVTGSDQVWNPDYAGYPYEFLTFAPKEKRLSFAASIGVDEIPDDKKWYYKKNLSDMKYLTVREDGAYNIIKELTGRTADITLDPTLLLKKDDWEKIVKKPQLQIEDKYICTYFLGDVPEAVNAFAKEKNIPVYNLNAQENPDFFTLDPGEFLYIIKNATYILTDSFHAVAFSIKFNKEFYVFKREQKNVVDMFSRIETITKRFGLENRIKTRDKIIEEVPIDSWVEIEEELINEKNKSISKLLEVMGVING